MAEWWLSPPLPPPPPPPLVTYGPHSFDPYYPGMPVQPIAPQVPVLPGPPQVPVLSGPPQVPMLSGPPQVPVLPPPQAQHSLPALQLSAAMPPPPMLYMPPPKPDNPREIRNKAEKQRRDKLNKSIAELASLVPPVVYSAKKIDKTGVLRYTAHYLRAHQYVFDSLPDTSSQFTQSSTQAILSLLNGFLLTTTYKGLIVVVSQNINEYLGYTELELLGKSIFSLVHEEDQQLLRNQLMPRSPPLGNHGELLVPNDEEGRLKIAQALADEKRCFNIRFLKLGQRSEPNKYVTCHVEGSFRMSDRAFKGYNRCCLMVRRARARGDNPCSSGNDVVFIGVVRPCTETFINESALESYRMEYRTRHSIDGEIIQCEQRISLVTGYMMSEVSGINAMNFIHRDEVRWVIIALKEMYNQSQLFGESCYRLMMKNGQFIYMRTRGRLDVDSSSRAVTSFVCTNTVVDEKEGKQLIRMMKERFTLQASFDGHPVDDTTETNDSQAVEDPRQLEKVILNMVTTLPTIDHGHGSQASFSRGESPHRLALIPPKKERIVSAIEKIYTVIKTIPKQPIIEEIQSFPTIHENPPQTSNEETNETMTPPYSNTFNLPSFDELFQIQSGSEAKTSETYSPVASIDFDCLNPREMYALNEVNRTQLEMDSQIFSASVNVCDEMANHLSATNSTAGVKRPRLEEQEVTSNKKSVGETNENAASQQATHPNSGRDTPTLEMFFDEEVLLNHIQSAMASFEDTGDLTFSDILNSGDVDDILGIKNSKSG